MTAPAPAPAPARDRAIAGAWRTLLSPPQTGWRNMAIDVALMRHARRTGERTLRVYSWSAPTLSFGRHQVVHTRVRRDIAAAMGVALVRRPTGGRALLHHREATYSVSAPLAPGDSARDWYRAINGVLLGAMRLLGVDARPAVVEGPTPVPGTAPCFLRADDGEIAVGGRKLIGSALVREEGAILQHGSILIEDDQAMLARLLPAGETPPAEAATLKAALGRTPAVDEVAQSLFDALRSGGAQPEALEPGDPLFQADVREAEALFASEAWTFRA